MKSLDKIEEETYENHRRKKYLHAFKKKVEYQKEIQKLDDEIIGWILNEKRKEDKKKPIDLTLPKVEDLK